MKDLPFVLISGTSHPGFAKNVAVQLSTSLGSVQIEEFPDGEIGVKIQENVRGREVFVIQTGARRPNDFLMELLVIADALKRASAAGIVAVLPYYPYARQDHKNGGREPITARLVADLLERAGVTRVVAMDLHAQQIQGFFTVPVDNLCARPLLVQEVQKMDLKDLVVVSPDFGRDQMARKFAEALKCELAIVDKRSLRKGQQNRQALVGKVDEKTALLVDDICSTGTTLEMAAELCRARGAQKIVAVLSHGLFVSKRLPEGIDQFVVTDSVPPNELARHASFRCISVAPLFARAIQCIVEGNADCDEEL